MTEPHPTPSTRSDSPSGRVVVLGSLNADVFVRVERHPRPGETVFGTSGGTRPGGKGANQAVAAALAGAPVAMIGAVGRDAHAEVALTGLTAAGVDISGVRVVDGPTGTAQITVDGAGENSIIVITGANAEVDDPDLAGVRTAGPADTVVLQGEIPLPVATAGAFCAASAGARVIVNLAPVVPYPADVLRLADPLVVNEHEGTGALAILDPAATPAEAPEELARQLLGAGVPSVVMTLGGAGALVGAGEDVTAVRGESVEVVDTTGAGDAFVGALAAGIVGGAPLVEAAQSANRYAAEAVQHDGAQDSYPDWRRS
ncbi:MAG: ribokinase [Micrococcales bacterium]|nr:ribokinase [Micrococcales bacterium]